MQGQARLPVSHFLRQHDLVQVQWVFLSNTSVLHPSELDSNDIEAGELFQLERERRDSRLVWRVTINLTQFAYQTGKSIVEKRCRQQQIA